MSVSLRWENLWRAFERAPTRLASVAVLAAVLVGLLGRESPLAAALVLVALGAAVFVKESVHLVRENGTLRLALDTVEDAVVILDAERNIAFTNQGFRRAFGDVWGGHGNFASLLVDAFRPAGMAPLASAIETASAWRGRLERKEPAPDDGRRRFWEISVSPVATSDAPTASLLVRLHDVTQRIIDERLRRLEEEGERAKADVALALAAEEAPLAERCFASLASLCQMEGLEQLTRGALYAMNDAGSALARLTYCGNLSEASSSAPYDMRCEESLKEGRIVIVDACAGDARMAGCDLEAPHGHYVVPLLERPGQVLGALVLYTNEHPISDTPRLETLTAVAESFTNAVLRDRTARLLVESTKRAEEATKAKSDFLATMSHEIRTPMNGVLGFTQLLLESQLGDEQREYAQLIYNSAEALLLLLNDILDFSKIEAGKLVVDPRPVAIVEASKEAVGLLRAAALKKGLELSFRASNAVPRGVLIDGMRFRQVLINLTGNAVKFTPAGTVDVSLDVEVEGELRWLRVDVRDSGIGIAPGVLSNLFARFVQADTSTSRRFGGTGLGLAISKRLVELMGGTIGAVSTEGQGSVFWFRLPLVEAVVEGGRRSESKTMSVLRHRRVLLAEDNPVNQILARKVLEKMSAEVVVAPDGKKAVELAQAGGFDLILMDCQMPELDGYDATRAIRLWEASAKHEPLPIVAVTANAFADDRQRCIDAGMDAVLTKPFKLGDLEQILRDLAPPARRAEGAT